jgi:hypothetical protein
MLLPTPAVKRTELPASIYRLPGRRGVGPVIPAPALRTLAFPLVQSASAVAVLLLPLVAFNLWDRHRVGADPWVPAVDIARNGLALAGLVSYLVLFVVLARRVVPTWSGMTPLRKVAYVASLLVLHSGVVVLGEGMVSWSGGGFRLFEPRLVAAARGPAGHQGFLYEEGLFGCTYTWYEAEPYALTMRSAGRVERKECSTPPPRLSWEGGSHLIVVGTNGAPLEAESVPVPFFGWGGGC